MSVVQLPDHLKSLIDRLVAEGRVATEAEFLEQAVRRHAEDLQAQEDAIVAAATAGIADIEAGRYSLISGSGGTAGLRTELMRQLDELESEQQHRVGPASR